VWIGSWTDGLWQLDMKPATPRVLLHLPGTAFTDRNIDALEPAPNGALWVGTSNGLNLLNLRTHAIERIMPKPQDPRALGEGVITSLATDLRGRLWVATLGDGVSVMSGRNGGQPQFRRIGVSDGLPNANADTLLRDRRGYMWLSTDKGMARIDPTTLAARTFGEADGLQISAYWGNSGAVTPYGDLLFGGGDGLTIVRPDDVRTEQFVAPVVVTDVRVGEQPIPAVRSHGGARTDPIEVPADRNEVAVEFAALDYSAPALNQYEYRLDGFDRDWIVTDPSRRTATYTNLPPGNYTLHVRGSNRIGTYGPDLLVPIGVAAAWYQTVWFHIAEALAAVVGVIVIVRLRTSYLQARERELERIVYERTAELELATTELQEKSRALEEASLTDPLTGLRNRRFLNVHLESDAQLTIRQYETATQPPHDSDLIFFLADIDHFKMVNDEHGHAAGDAVLVQMRGRIESVFRESDYCVRWGGEEFLVVSRGTPRESAAVLAERVRAAVADEPFAIDGGTLSKTCSVGFAAFPFVELAPRAFGWEEVTNLADIALYAAKNAGRNGWVGLSVPAETKPALVERLHRSPQAEVVAGAIAFESNLDRAAVLKAFAPG
jgi:diguanylate cyclase (GGDEF)-like protein